MRGKLPVAVVGATGIVGQYFMWLLDNHPYFITKKIAASNEKAGKKYGEALKGWVPPIRLPEQKYDMTLTTIEDILNDDEIRIVFSALPKNVAIEIEPVLAKKGKIVVSNASFMRMDETTPLINGEVNFSHLRIVEEQKKKYGWGGAIIKNPNCTTAILTLTLKPLLEEFGIEKLYLTTLQSLSGAGMRGYYVLEMNGNVIPFIPNEEEKIERETAKILGKIEGKSIREEKIKMKITTTRVPVEVGHTEILYVVFKEKPGGEEEIVGVLSSWRGEGKGLSLHSLPERPIIVYDSEDRPQPKIDSLLYRGLSVGVGRIKIMDDTTRLVIVGNNLSRGAAGAAILIAEYIYKYYEELI